MTIFTSDRRELLRKMQLPILIASCFAPLPMLISCIIIGEGWAASLITPAAYILLCWLLLFVPGRCRMAAGIAACAVIMLSPMLVMPVMQHAALMFPPVLFTVLMVYSIPMAAWKADREVHLGLSCVGVVMHLVAQLLINADEKLDDAARYLPIRTPLFVCFLVMMLLQLFSMNRDNMLRAVNGGSKAPDRLRRRNLVITMAVFAAALIISALPAIIAAANRLWDAAWKLVGDAVLWIFNLFGQNSSGTPREGGGGGIGGGLVGSMEVNPLAAFMQQVAIVLAVAALVLIVLWALRVIFLKIVQLIRFLIDRMKKYMHAASEDYTDEITDVRDDEGGHDSALNTLRKRLARRRVDENALVPREKIRHAYRRVSRRHPEWSRSATARESIPESAAALYEKARYSAHDVTEQDAEQFRKGVKNV